MLGGKKVEVEYIEIGQIINTHGLKGELKVKPSTDDIRRFELLEEVSIKSQNGLRVYPIASVRYFKQFVLLQLEGIDTITEAEKFKTCVLQIPIDLALPLEEDEYYIRDLYDMDVVTQDGEALGHIKEVLFTGGNDVYVVENPMKAEGKDLLIPAIKECIIKVDTDQNMMTVKLLEGLRD